MIFVCKGMVYAEIFYEGWCCFPVGWHSPSTRVLRTYRVSADSKSANSLTVELSVQFDFDINLNYALCSG